MTTTRRLPRFPTCRISWRRFLRRSSSAPTRQRSPSAALGCTTRRGWLRGIPDLWTQILLANADHLATALAGFASDVTRTVDDLQRVAAGDRAAAAALTETLRRGAAGRARVPVKRGQPAAGFVTVPIVVRDAPGELASVLRALGDAGINVEDVRVEHEPGRARGVVELDVREDAASKLIACMQEAGWEVYS